MNSRLFSGRTPVTITFYAVATVHSLTIYLPLLPLVPSSQVEAALAQCSATADVRMWLQSKVTACLIRRASRLIECAAA